MVYYWPMVVRNTWILVTEANPLGEMFGHIMTNASLENYASKTVGCSYGNRNSGKKEKRLSSRNYLMPIGSVFVLIPLAALLMQPSLNSFFPLDVCADPLDLTFLAKFAFYLSLVSPQLYFDFWIKFFCVTHAFLASDLGSTPVLTRHL